MHERYLHSLASYDHDSNATQLPEQYMLFELDVYGLKYVFLFNLEC